MGGGGEYIPFLHIFMTYHVKNAPISWFRKTGFKILLFLWYLEHILDPKCSRRVTAAIYVQAHYIEATS